jgi:membrane protease YdiL (CAAX protease family)
MFGMNITSETTSSGVFLGQDRRPRLAWRILLAWLGFFGCLLLIGTTIQAATGWLPPVLSHAAAGVGVAAGTLGLVFLLRRYADRRPWSGIGLTLDRTAIPHLLSGIALAAVVTTAAAVATVQLGLADWGGPGSATDKVAERGLATTIIVIVISTLLVQGFPEELVFRGYMFRNLGGSLPLWVTVAGSSLIFGSMHVLSDGGASTLTVHQDAVIPAWLIVLGVLIVAAALTIALRQWRAPLDWRAVPGDA